MRDGPWVTAICVMATVVGAAAPVHAFVRETTGAAGGTPLRWPGGCAVVAVPDPGSPDVSWDDLLAATRAAAQTWTDAAASCGGGFRFDVERAQAGGLGVRGDGVNAVVFRRSNYCDSQQPAPRCDPSSLAISWLYYDDRQGSASAGDVHEADVEIDGEAYAWGPHGDPQARLNDLQSMLTHELGHVLGLDHDCYESGLGLPPPVDDQGNPAPDCSSATPDTHASVMFPEASYFGERRTLSSDDVRGVCAIYPQAAGASCQGRLAPQGGCAIAGAAAAGSAPSWAAGGLPALGAAIAFAWRRRTHRARPLR